VRQEKKANAARSVELATPIAAIMDQLRLAWTPAHEYSGHYFFSHGHAKLNSITGFWQKKLIPAFASIKVENVHSHRFRHPLATKLLKPGGPRSLIATPWGMPNKWSLSII